MKIKTLILFGVLVSMLSIGCYNANNYYPAEAIPPTHLLHIPEPTETLEPLELLEPLEPLELLKPLKPLEPLELPPDDDDIHMSDPTETHESLEPPHDDDTHMSGPDESLESLELPPDDDIHLYEPTDTLESVELPHNDGLIKIGLTGLFGWSDWDLTILQDVKDTFCEANGFNLSFIPVYAGYPVDYSKDFFDGEMDYFLVYLWWLPDDDDINEFREIRNKGTHLISINPYLLSLSDDNIYTSSVTIDFSAEAMQAIVWLEEYLNEIGRGDDSINIVHITSPGKAEYKTKRTTEITQGIDRHINWNLLESRHYDDNYSAINFGREEMRYFINKYPDIDVLIAEEDHLALVAIEEIKAVDKKPGDDIIIVSIGGTRSALEAIVAGDLNVTVEFTPFFSSKIYEIIQRLEQGETVEKIEYVDNMRVFDWTNAEEELPFSTY